MASEAEASCESDPNFAIICAFMEKFGESCGIPSIDFIELQQMLENNQEVSPELMNLHIKLLRKTKKNVTVERWERALINMCHTFSSKDAWEIERFGYKKTRLRIKLRALKELLEMQFDFNTKFKNEVNKMTAEQLRSQPLGRDKLGRSYWFQTDNNYQIRIYKEDPDEETWNLIAKDRDGLLLLITELSDGDSKLSSDSACNEDSNSLLEKPFIDTGQNENSVEIKLKEEAAQKADKRSILNTHSNFDLPNEKPKSEFDHSSKLDNKKFDSEKKTLITIQEPAQKSVEGFEEGEVVKPKVEESTEIRRPMLRIKSLSELMEKPKEPPRPNFLPDLPELTIIKKPKLDLREITIVKRPRMQQPPRIRTQVSPAIKSPVMIIRGNGSGRENNCSNTVIGKTIVEPVLIFSDRGSGRDCEAGNERDCCNKVTEKNEESINDKECDDLFIGDEIEEPVLYFVGRGFGTDCETGNEKDASKVDTEDEKLKSSSASTIPPSQADTGETAKQVPTSQLTNIKLGTVIDSKTDSKTFLPRCPNKRSRWDQMEIQGSEMEEKTENSLSPKKMTFFFGPGSLNVKPGPALNSSTGELEHEHSERPDIVSDEMFVNDSQTTVEKKESKEVLEFDEDDKTSENYEALDDNEGPDDNEAQDDNEAPDDNGAPKDNEALNDNEALEDNAISSVTRSPEENISTIAGSENKDKECTDCSDFETIPEVLHIQGTENCKNNLSIEQQVNVTSSVDTNEESENNAIREEPDAEGDHQNNLFVTKGDNEKGIEHDQSIQKTNLQNERDQGTDGEKLIITCVDDEVKEKLNNEMKENLQNEIEENLRNVMKENNHSPTQLKSIDSKTEIENTEHISEELKHSTEVATDKETECGKHDIKSVQHETEDDFSESFELAGDISNRTTMEELSEINRKSDRLSPDDNSIPKGISDGSNDEVSGSSQPKVSEDIKESEMQECNVSSEDKNKSQSSDYILKNSNSSGNNKDVDIVEIADQNTTDEIAENSINCSVPIHDTCPVVPDDKLEEVKSLEQKEFDDDNADELLPDKTVSADNNLVENFSDTGKLLKDQKEVRINENKVEDVDELGAVSEQNNINDNAMEVQKDEKSLNKSEVIEYLDNIKETGKETEKEIVTRVDKRGKAKKSEENVKVNVIRKSIRGTDDKRLKRGRTAEMGPQEIDNKIKIEMIKPPIKDEVKLEQRRTSKTNTESVSPGKKRRGRKIITPESKKAVGGNILSEQDGLTSIRPVRQTRQTRATIIEVPLIQSAKGRGRKKTQAQTIKSDETGSTDSPIPLESVTVNDVDSNSAAADNTETDPLAVSEEDLENGDQPVSSITSFSFDYDPNSPASQPLVGKKNRRKRGRESFENKPEAGETIGKKPKIKGRRTVDLTLRKSVEEKRQKEVGDVSTDENEPTSKKETKVKKRGSPKKNTVTPPVSDSDHAAQKMKNISEKRNARLLKNLGVREEDISALADSPVPVRQSRRLAQIKIKEDAATRRKIEEDDVSATRKKKKKKEEDKDFKGGKRKRFEEEVKPAPTPPVIEKKKRRKKKHNKISIGWNTSSEDSENTWKEDEEVSEYEYEEPHEEEPLQFKSDHEFSPESDLEGDEQLPHKRARTARKEESDDGDVEEEFLCQKCGKSDHPEWILLCDKCDNGWHCSCLRPALFVIPEGDWFCPTCQHEKLLENLHEKLVEFDKLLVKKGMEDRRKERLAYVGISLNNVLPAKDKKEKKSHKSSGSSVGDSESESGSDSARSSNSDEPIYQLRQRRQAHSYKFQDYDDLINSALQEEPPTPVEKTHTMGRGKDIATIVNAAKEEEERNAEKNGFDDLPPVVPKDSIDIKKKALSYRKKPKRLNNLEVNSDDEADDSDEDFKGSSCDESEEDEFEEDSEDSYVGRKSSRPVRRSTRARTTRYDAGFIDDDDSDDAARKKKKKKVFFDDSESEQSDDWSGGRKKQRKISPNKKSKKKKKRFDDSDLETYRKKKPKIKYGMDSDNDDTLGRRTRGKRTSYLDTLGSDSEEEALKKKNKDKSDEEYVAEDDDKESEDEFDAEIDKDSGEEKVTQEAKKANSDEKNSNSEEEGPIVVKKLKFKNRRTIMDSEDEDENSEISQKINNEDKVNDESITFHEPQADKVEEKLELDRHDEILPKKNLEIKPEDNIEILPIKAAEIIDDKSEEIRQLEKKALEKPPSVVVPMLNVEKLKACGITLTKVSKEKLDATLSTDEAKSPSNLMEIGVKPIVPTLSQSSSQILAPVTIERIERNLEEFKDEEVEEMMGNEEYANKQLQSVSTGIRTKLMKEEFKSIPALDESKNFVKSPFSIMSNRKLGDNSLKKFRTGRFFNMRTPQEPLLGNSISLRINNDDNDELSEPPGLSLPLFSEIGPSSIQNLPKSNNTNIVSRNCTPPPIGPNRIIPMVTHNVGSGGPHVPLSMNVPVNPPYAEDLNSSMGINNHIRLNHPVGPILGPNSNISDSTNNTIGGPSAPNIPVVVNMPLVHRANATATPSSISPDGTTKKRRGRALSGKGKKTLAAEAAAAAAAAGLPVPETVTNKTSPNKSLAPNIEIASPPQPFSQSQPAPSVITRMLQSSPGKGAFPVGRIRPKQFAMMSDVDNEDEGSISLESHGDTAHKDVSPHPLRPTHPPGHYATSVSGQYPANYYQKESQVPTIAYHHQRSTQPQMHSYPQPPPQTSIDQSSINPPQLNQPPVNQPPINQPSINQKQINQSPISQCQINQPPTNPTPISQSPINLADSTPPPIGQYSSTSDSSKQPYDSVTHRPSYGNTNSSYGYDYNAAAAPSVMNTEEVLHTTAYENSAVYPEQYENPVPSLDPNPIKTIEEEPSGEFGGLVSYFSSQHEDDLDT